jgi:glycosyltransferase involved in cell wall biosynthesis
MLEASVVIATRDRAALLRGCLARLGGQSCNGRFEVVVVDNGSTDGTADAIEAARRNGLPVRAVFVADPNRGKARNAGIAAAVGESLIFCDDDTLAPEGFVEAHLAARARHPRAVVSGPIVNVSDDRSLPSPGPANFSRAFLCTCNAGVSRADVIAVGGFDERYDLYGWEDTDLGVRLRRAGSARAWSWDAFLYHLKPPETLALDKRLALAREKGAMAARFVNKSPTLDVRLATGAYAANFARAALVGAPPLRRWYERAVRASRGTPSGFAAFACDALVDAEYIDALRTGLRRADG